MALSGSGAASVTPITPCKTFVMRSVGSVLNRLRTHRGFSIAVWRESRACLTARQPELTASAHRHRDRPFVRASARLDANIERATVSPWPLLPPSGDGGERYFKGLAGSGRPSFQLARTVNVSDVVSKRHDWTNWPLFANAVPNPTALLSSKS
jgi:hypothetical protein